MISQILPGFIPKVCQRLAEHYYWTCSLPRTTEATVDGVHLDISGLSLLMRNRVLKAGYEIHEAALCRQYLERGDAVLELGAGIGFIGLVCQKIIGIQRHVMVEANPETVKLLKRNFALNHLQPTVWNFAIADAETAIGLNVNGEFMVNALVGISRDPQTTSIQVPSITLPSLLGRMPEANVLVIDIEGAERLIDFACLPQQIEKVIIELHPELIGYPATFDIVARLVGSGFCVARVLDFDDRGGSFAFLRSKPKTRSVEG